MVRIMLKCKTVEGAIAQLEYMKTFVSTVAQGLSGQQLRGKNNLGNYTVFVEVGTGNTKKAK